ncbi:MAG: triose-phosphate isomerase [Candidatus Zixiibacteriota bacterium]
MRRYVIAGNWKMQKDDREAVELCNAIRSGYKPDDRYELVICPPFTSIASAVETVKGTDIAVGGQNICWEAEGAFTGEVSAQMLLTAGCKYVILGHSERREYLSEGDQLIGTKVQLALSTGLVPIVCVGEKIEERESGRTEDVVGGQFDGVFADIDKAGFDKCVVAYEPVWAIGTGKTATPEMADDVHRFIRGRVEKKFGRESAEKMRILYGGSMKPTNSAELLAQPNIDGGLIGGASLKADSFLGIASTIK